MKEKIKMRKREITLVIIVNMVLIFFFSGFSIGKSISKSNVNVNGEIAKPIFKVENENKVNLTKTNEKGIYNFKVKNYDEQNEVSQIELEYYIEILSDINENLDFKIFKENEEININENKTEKFIMKKNNKQEDVYRIEIQTKNNISIEEIIQEIQIKVHSEQKRI